jgi:predicted nucleotidyltransferase
MKITQQYLEKNGKEIAEIIKKIPGVKGIAFMGSLVHGLVDQYSDIDVVVFCTKIPNKENRLKLLSQNHKMDFSEASSGWVADTQDMFYFEGSKEKSCIEYVKIESVNRKIKAIKVLNHLSNGSSFKRMMLWVWNTKVLWDPKNIIKKWKVDIKMYYLKLRKHIPFLLNIVDKHSKRPYTRSFGRGDVINLHAFFNQMLEQYILALFLLNNDYMVFPKKVTQRINLLKHKPKNCAKLLNEAVQLGYDERNFRKKMQILGNLARETKDIVDKVGI